MLGCCGVIYQTKRDGRCPGRRLLTIYELLLIGIFVGQGYVAVDLLEMANSLDIVTDGGATETYDSFEESMAGSFNEFYIAAQAATTDEFEWFVEMVRDDIKCS